jgi:hypothetical protein
MTEPTSTPEPGFNADSIAGIVISTDGVVVGVIGAIVWCLRKKVRPCDESKPPRENNSLLLVANNRWNAHSRENPKPASCGKAMCGKWVNERDNEYSFDTHDGLPHLQFIHYPSSEQCLFPSSHRCAGVFSNDPSWSDYDSQK